MAPIVSFAPGKYRPGDIDVYSWVVRKSCAEYARQLRACGRPGLWSLPPGAYRIDIVAQIPADAPRGNDGLPAESFARPGYGRWYLPDLPQVRDKKTARVVPNLGHPSFASQAFKIAHEVAHEALYRAADFRTGIAAVHYAINVGKIIRRPCRYPPLDRTVALRFIDLAWCLDNRDQIMREVADGSAPRTVIGYF